MNTVRELLLSRRPTELPSISPERSVAFALELMAEKGVGALLVVQDGHVVGVFSERDYARKLLLKGRSSLVTSVSDVMVREVIYVTPDYLLEECLAVMASKRIRHLPVLDLNRRPIAFLSMEEIVSKVIEGRDEMIAELTKYVTGASVLPFQKPEIRPPLRLEGVCENVTA